MQEQLVSFETAKLAKEKGFDEICLDVYSYIGVLQNRYNIIFNDVDDPDSLKEALEVTNSNLEEVWKNHNAGLRSHKPFIAAPTQSLLQKWLRESHNIHIWILYKLDELKCPYELNVIIKDFSNLKFLHILDKEIYSTYEEALEKGLFNALNFINYKKSTNG